jgi:hypothetical protein
MMPRDELSPVFACASSVGVLGVAAAADGGVANAGVSVRLVASAALAEGIVAGVALAAAADGFASARAALPFEFPWATK